MTSDAANKGKSGAEFAYRKNARVFLYYSVKDATRLGLKRDAEIGRLYNKENSYEELLYSAQALGLNPRWVQNKEEGMLYFFLWGMPLNRAKAVYKNSTLEEAKLDVERFEDSVRTYQETAEAEIKAEARKDDLILTNCGYVAFVSKSKGLYRSKSKGTYRILRKHWKEVELFRYGGSSWHTEKHSEFDVWNQELTQERMDADALMIFIKERCDRKGGGVRGLA